MRVGVRAPSYPSTNIHKQSRCCSVVHRVGSPLDTSWHSHAHPTTLPRQPRAKDGVPLIYVCRCCGCLGCDGCLHAERVPCIGAVPGEDARERTLGRGGNHGQEEREGKAERVILPPHTMYTPCTHTHAPYVTLHMHMCTGTAAYSMAWPAPIAACSDNISMPHMHASSGEAECTPTQYPPYCIIRCAVCAVCTVCACVCACVLTENANALQYLHSIVLSVCTCARARKKERGVSSIYACV